MGCPALGGTPHFCLKSLPHRSFIGGLRTRVSSPLYSNAGHQSIWRNPRPHKGFGLQKFVRYYRRYQPASERDQRSTYRTTSLMGLPKFTERSILMSRIIISLAVSIVLVASSSAQDTGCVAQTTGTTQWL